MTYPLQQERLHFSETRRRIYSEIHFLNFFYFSFFIFQDRRKRELLTWGFGHGRIYVWALAASLTPSLPSLVCLCLGSLCLALAPEPTHTSALLPTPWTRCLKSSGGSASYAWEKGMSCVDKRSLSEPGRRRFSRSVSCTPAFPSAEGCVCLCVGGTFFGLHRYTIQELLRF